MSRTVGGLGFKKFKNINQALLTKLGRMMAIKDERLWVRVMASKYLKAKSFFNCVAKKEDLSVWKSILKTKIFIQRGSCYNMGNGWDISYESDPWVLGVFSKSLQIMDQVDGGIVASWKVAKFINAKNRKWNPEILRQHFLNDESTLIQNILLPLMDCQDKLCCTEAKDGKFSMKSAYALINSEGNFGKEVWGLIWRSNLHERLNEFLWRMARFYLWAVWLGGGTCHAPV